MEERMLSAVATQCFQNKKRLHSQAGSDTAVCEDLRELRDEAEGVRLWLKRSSASFRLAVLSCDSEPESCDCCKGRRRKVAAVSSVPALRFLRKPHRKWDKPLTLSAVISGCDSSMPSSRRCSALTSA